MQLEEPAPPVHVHTHSCPATKRPSAHAAICVYASFFSTYVNQAGWKGSGNLWNHQRITCNKTWLAFWHPGHTFHSHSPLSLPLCLCYLFLGLHVLLEAINTSKAMFERAPGGFRSPLLTEMQQLSSSRRDLNLFDVIWIRLTVYGCFFNYGHFWALWLF